MSDETTVTLTDQAAATRLDDDTMVVLHLQEQTYFELNRTGSRIWEYLSESGSATLDELVDLLRSEADDDVSRDEVQEDVTTFVSSMREAGLVAEE